MHSRSDRHHAFIIPLSLVRPTRGEIQLFLPLFDLMVVEAGAIIYKTLVRDAKIWINGRVGRRLTWAELEEALRPSCLRLLSGPGGGFLLSQAINQGE